MAASILSKQRRKVILERKRLHQRPWKGERRFSSAQAGGIAVGKDPSLHGAHGERGRGPWARPQGSRLQGALTLKILSGALFMLRFLILTVSWQAVLHVRRYLLMRGLGNSVPSKCFSPKTNRLRKQQGRETSLHMHSSTKPPRLTPHSPIHFFCI